ncbi:MAG: permease, partial [Cocleimonas sp.]|nr:permease [Cocleimonas sp.]
MNLNLFFENFLMLSLDAAPWLVLGLIIGGLIKTLVPTAWLEKHLKGEGFSSVLKAALLGAPLPLCSCGVLPAALGLRQAGASKAATTSFLISTPETGVDSVMVTYALLGPVMAITRPIAAIISAITAGLLVGKGETTARQTLNTPIESCCTST